MITFRTVVSWLAQDLAGRVSTERLQVARTEQEIHSVLPTWSWVAVETVSNSSAAVSRCAMVRMASTAHWGQEEAYKATGIVCRRSEQGSCPEFPEGEVDRNGQTVWRNLLQWCTKWCVNPPPRAFNAEVVLQKAQRKAVKLLGPAPVGIVSIPSLNGRKDSTGICVQATVRALNEPACKPATVQLSEGEEAFQNIEAYIPTALRQLAVGEFPAVKGPHSKLLRQQLAAFLHVSCTYLRDKCVNTAEGSRLRMAGCKHLQSAGDSSSMLLASSAFAIAVSSPSEACQLLRADLCSPSQVQGN